MDGSLAFEWIQIQILRVWFSLHYFPCGQICLSASGSLLHPCGPFFCFLPSPSSLGDAQLKLQPTVFSMRLWGTLVHCCLFFCSFQAFSHPAARLQTHCAISQLLPAILPLIFLDIFLLELRGTHLQSVCDSPLSPTDLDFITTSWTQYNQWSKLEIWLPNSHKLPTTAIATDKGPLIILYLNRLCYTPKVPHL